MSRTLREHLLPLKRRSYGSLVPSLLRAGGVHAHVPSLHTRVQALGMLGETLLCSPAPAQARYQHAGTDSWTCIFNTEGTALEHLSRGFKTSAARGASQRNHTGMHVADVHPSGPAACLQETFMNLTRSAQLPSGPTAGKNNMMQRCPLGVWPDPLRLPPRRKDEE